VALRALATINLAAVERNVARLRAGLAGGAQLCAVVKADASSHGAVPVARAALAAGASSLAVATVGEAAELRAAGIDAPVLIMGAISAEELPVALAARGEVVAWTPRFVEDLAAAVGEAAPIRVHVKLDSGMGRLGTRSAGEALAVADGVLTHAPELVLAGAMTHFATADDDDAEFMAAQLAAFAPVAQAMRERAPGLVVHAANSAATVRDPATHLDMVRCGIALYGCDPMNVGPDATGLEPAMELSSYVAAVKLARAGESSGYGRRFIARHDCWIATLPIGYADGIRRGLSDNCDVLVGGRRFPLVGTVSMDNVTIDLGPVSHEGAGPRVAVGTGAILIGRSGSERQTVEDLANRLGTVAHEVLCGIGPRVTRRYHRDGVPAP
jgi:alanine racemase